MDLRLPSPCPCGRTHPPIGAELLAGSGVLEELPEKLRAQGFSRPFLIADRNTAPYADEVSSLLSRAGIGFSRFDFPEAELAPDERAAGSLAMRFDPRADLVIAVGSGVLNDLGKLLACLSGRPYFIIATAPSMDGFASATSSMDRDGLKVSLP
ncbi:MAG: iron-containing alcohol dehydrogenase, partial [Clostridia bacterium]|nr:iron-containing alcohol dehydrogenase [Clostridia bacterium]